MNDDLPPDLATVANLLRRAATDEAPPASALSRAIALDGALARMRRAGSGAFRQLVALAAGPAAGGGLLGPAWGVRGSAPQPAQWLYEVEEFEIDLRALPKGETWTVSGQLFGVEAVASVTLEGATEVPKVTDLGPTQEFTFAGVPPGQYRLKVSAADFEITVPSIELGDAAAK